LASVTGSRQKKDDKTMKAKTSAKTKKAGSKAPAKKKTAARKK